MMVILVLHPQCITMFCSVLLPLTINTVMLITAIKICLSTLMLPAVMSSCDQQQPKIDCINVYIPLHTKTVFSCDNYFAGSEETKN